MAIATASSKIPRVTTVPDSLDELDAELATKAKDLLGYRAMAHERARTTGLRKLFADVLAAGIQPLDEKAVQAYKRRTHRNYWLRSVAFQLVFLAVAGAGMTAMTKYDNWIGLPMVIGSIIATACMWITTAPANWAWRLHTLNDYSRPIPAHVLQTALIASKLIRSYQQSGEYLGVEEFAYERTVRDPFLYIFRDGARVYLDVWDEPTFKD